MTDFVRHNEDRIPGPAVGDRYGSRVRLMPYNKIRDDVNDPVFVDANQVVLLEPAYPKGPVIIGGSLDQITKVHCRDVPGLHVMGSVDEVAALLWARSKPSDIISPVQQADAT